MPVAFSAKYIRQCYREKNGQRHAYWALVESYRTASGPRQRIVAWLGKLDEAGRLGVKHAADDARKDDAWRVVDPTTDVQSSAAHTAEPP